MTTNFIVFCMEYLINLFILFLHILHLFQPLDVNVFIPLKHALTEKTNTISQLDSNCISRANWISMFVQIKSQTLISKNMLVK